MPYINIRLGTVLENTQKAQLYTQTTALMKNIMGKKPQLTVVQIQESEPQQWSINAQPLSNEHPIAVYVDIKITQDTNTPEEKATMIQQTVKMLQDVVGTLQEACYVVIDEIPANSWGYNGRTQAARAVLKV